MSRNGNLSLTRKLNEVICIGDDIEIEVIRLNNSFVRLAIRAPRELLVLRQELKGREMEPRPATEVIQ